MLLFEVQCRAKGATSVFVCRSVRRAGRLKSVCVCVYVFVCVCVCEHDFVNERIYSSFEDGSGMVYFFFF